MDDAEADVRLARVTLSVGADRFEDLRAFYGSKLGLVETGSLGAFAVGPDVLAFSPGPGAPFYHFALLVGDLDAALARARSDVDLLPHRETGEVVFDFAFWDARACYFHDPAGNIVELIEHAPSGEDALLGISEVGVVSDDPLAEVDRWAARGAPVWSGGLDDDGSGLAFCGAKAHTVIVCKTGRGWLPTNRSAEPHPVDVVLG